jgi:hypothetical protein
MNNRRLRWSAVLLFLLAGCSPFAGGYVYDEELVGPYRLTAIDSLDQMAVYWDVPGGGAVGDGLPGPQVFKAGFDDRYLVAAVHPPRCNFSYNNCTDLGINSQVTQYWYVIRQADEAKHLPYQGIKGPFSEAQFTGEKSRLGLPDFNVAIPK